MKESLDRDGLADLVTTVLKGGRGLQSIRAMAQRGKTVRDQFARWLLHGVAPDPAIATEGNFSYFTKYVCRSAAVVACGMAWSLWPEEEEKPQSVWWPKGEAAFQTFCRIAAVPNCFDVYDHDRALPRCDGGGTLGDRCGIAIYIAVCLLDPKIKRFLETGEVPSWESRNDPSFDRSVMSALLRAIKEGIIVVPRNGIVPMFIRLAAWVRKIEPFTDHEGFNSDGRKKWIGAVAGALKLENQLSELNDDELKALAPFWSPARTFAGRRGIVLELPIALDREAWVKGVAARVSVGDPAEDAQRFNSGTNALELHVLLGAHNRAECPDPLDPKHGERSRPFMDAITRRDIPEVNSDAMRDACVAFLNTPAVAA